ncbi:MAG: hypothetical protein H6Q37_580 [Chloroflexi bacterium]|nr:hypothetical protein [Chloroflexota bacterium]
MRNSTLAILEWALLLSALAALTVTEVYRWYVAAGLALLVVSFAVRAWRTGRFLPRTGLEIAWVLGLASASVAVWVAYDRPTAFLQFDRLLAACVLYYAVVAIRESNTGIVHPVRWPAAGFLVMAAALALYWPAHTDFAAQTAKMALITRLGIGLHHLLPIISGPDVHPNVAAGTLLAALPFGVALGREAWRDGPKWLAWLAVVLSLAVLGGLFMTGSRGAWLALAGVSVLALLVWVQRRWFGRPRQQLIFWSVVVLAGLLALAAVALTGNLDHLAGQISDPSGGIQSRVALWEQGWGLVRAYPFTGSGLMSFWMEHATYSLLLNVKFIAHSHNTFLEVWIEQGVLGVIGLALAGLGVATWAWKALGRKEVSMWGWAGLAALLAASLHGLVDVVFYVTRTLPVIGLLFGYAWYLNEGHALSRKEQASTSRLSAWSITVLAFSGLIVIGLVGMFFHRQLLGLGYANLGAIQQTRAELTRYTPEHFDTYTLDQARRDSNLVPALASFARALRFDPYNRTALQRRAEIALSLGDYTAALNDTQRLWQAGYRDVVTRLLYGDALVADGQSAAAAEIVQGLTWAKSRLLGQAWYRYWLGNDYHRAIAAWSTVLLLNPEEPGIGNLIQQAQAKLK